MVLNICKHYTALWICQNKPWQIFELSWVVNMQGFLIWQGFAGVEVRFLFDRSFLLLTQSHCSLPIATKSFGSAVSPLFCPAFAGSSLCFNYREERDWQKVNVSSLFYSIFSSKNNVMYCLLISNTLQIQSWKRLTLSLSQHSKRLCYVTAHKHTFIYILQYQIKKQHLF